jgi:hypothetical protein
MKTMLAMWSALFLLVFPSICAVADDGSCVLCHTSEAVLKSLFKPPPMPAGAGEG